MDGQSDTTIEEQRKVKMSKPEEIVIASSPPAFDSSTLPPSSSGLAAVPLLDKPVPQGTSPVSATGPPGTPKQVRFSTKAPTLLDSASAEGFGSGIHSPQAVPKRSCMKLSSPTTSPTAAARSPQGQMAPLMNFPKPAAPSPVKRDDDGNERQDSVYRVSSLEKLNAQLRGGSDVVNARERMCDHCGKWFSHPDFAKHRVQVRRLWETENRHKFIFQYIFRPIADVIAWIVIHIFFREVSVVGAENIPKKGPVIFYANHQNQFVDGLVMRATCGRAVRFVIASVSMKRPVIGWVAYMMDAVPVMRPKDAKATSGTGKIVAMNGTKITGEGTRFTKELGYGDVVQWKFTSAQKASAQIVTVDSDTQLTVSQPIEEAFQVTRPMTFECSKRIDHSKMYGSIYETVKAGGAIGIFPEGGSHDRTSLQPLKAGVALFALGAHEEDVEVKMIPVGLTYFYGHKFRSRAHIEYGKALSTPPHLHDVFKYDKRKATGELLSKLNTGLRAVTINVPNWEKRPQFLQDW